MQNYSCPYCQQQCQQQYACPYCQQQYQQQCQQPQYIEFACPPEKLINCPGYQGPVGERGPRGATGATGPEGRLLGGDILSLSLLNTTHDYDAGAGIYQSVYYEGIDAQTSDQAIPPALPGDGPVILTAGHTYYITIATQGNYIVPLSAPPRVVVNLRLILNRNTINEEIIPDTTDPDFVWEALSYNFTHQWVYTADVDTTLEYQVASDDTDFTLNGSDLTIITLR